MKVNQLSINDLKVGLKMEGLVTGATGIVFYIDEKYERAWVVFSNNRVENFYRNECPCEIIEEKLTTRESFSIAHCRLYVDIRY